MLHWWITMGGVKGETFTLIMLSHHPGSHPYRRQEALLRGLPGPCQVIGGAVINRGADDRESEGDIDAVVKVQHLERDQPLIVVHGDHTVIATLLGKMEQGVGRQRSNGIDPFLPGSLNSRCDYLFLLGAELPPFPAVRVERQYRQLRRHLPGQTRHPSGGDANRPEYL